MLLNQGPSHPIWLEYKCIVPVIYEIFVKCQFFISLTNRLRLYFNNKIPTSLQDGVQLFFNETAKIQLMQPHKWNRAEKEREENSLICGNHSNCSLLIGEGVSAATGGRVRHQDTTHHHACCIVVSLYPTEILLCNWQAPSTCFKKRIQIPKYHWAR